MSVELEERLERVADVLPAPTTEARERSRIAALGALPERSRRPRRRALVLVPAAVVGVTVAVVAILAAPWQDSPLATERALAALGDEPVLHAIVEAPAPRSTTTLIELASGETSPELYRTEYWYDDERETLHALVTIGGQRVMEILDSPAGVFTDRGRLPGERPSSPRLDPSLAGFATGYREALESGEARVVGEEVVDGREAIVLRINLRPGPSGEEHWEEVAVGASDYRPLRFRFSSEVEASRWSQAPRVVEIEAVPRDSLDFAPPEPGEPRPVAQTGVEQRTLTLAEAVTALGRRVLWPGRAVGGVELTEIELMRMKTRWTDGRSTKSRVMVLQYGAGPNAGPRERWLMITEGTSAQEMPRFGPDVPPPAAGRLRLTGFGNVSGSDSDFWYASMQRDGVYISLQSPQRELILAAAKAMVPLG